MLKLKGPHSAEDNWWKSCSIAQEEGEGKTTPFKKNLSGGDKHFQHKQNKIDATNKSCLSVRTGCTWFLNVPLAFARGIYLLSYVSELHVANK